MLRSTQPTCLGPGCIVRARGKSFIRGSSLATRPEHVSWRFPRWGSWPRGVRSFSWHWAVSLLSRSRSPRATRARSVSTVRQNRLSAHRRRGLQGSVPGDYDDGCWDDGDGGRAAPLLPQDKEVTRAPGPLPERPSTRFVVLVLPGFLTIVPRTILACLPHSTGTEKRVGLGGGDSSPPKAIGSECPKHRKYRKTGTYTFQRF